MREFLEFLARHGYAVVFWFVLLEQFGMPLPAVPVLLCAGALAGEDRLDFGTVFFLMFLASTIADHAWYVAGRTRGAHVLRFVCKVSLEPDNCIRRTEDVFVRHGPRSLVYAKFVPGLTTVAPPLAGLFEMPLPEFLLFDAAGILLYGGLYLGLGYVLHEQVETVLDIAMSFGRTLGILFVLVTAAYLGTKWWERRRFLRDLRVARIEAEDLKARLDAGEAVAIVDLRHAIDVAASPALIPGAIHIDPDELEDRQAGIPRERAVVLYCT